MPDHDGFDLEVQVSATSVGLLRHLEVAVVSTWAPTIFPEDVGFSIVEPRDVHAAALSYDGREPPRVLRHLTTMPVPASSPHTLAPACYSLPYTGPPPGHSYVELVQPNDCARRIVRGMLAEGKPYPAQSIRYGLFGHNLEKGVVLRGRIRGVWIDAAVAAEESAPASRGVLARAPGAGSLRHDQPHVQLHSAAPAGKVADHRIRPVRGSKQGSAMGAEACQGPSSLRSGQVMSTASSVGCLSSVRSSR